MEKVGHLTQNSPPNKKNTWRILAFVGIFLTWFAVWNLFDIYIPKKPLVYIIIFFIGLSVLLVLDDFRDLA